MEEEVWYGEIGPYCKKNICHNSSSSIRVLQEKFFKEDEKSNVQCAFA